MTQLRTIYVVTTYTVGTGGFEWFSSEENALAFYKAEVFEMRRHPRGQYLPIYIGAVGLPTSLWAGQVTEWLDRERRDVWDVPTCIEDQEKGRRP